MSVFVLFVRGGSIGESQNATIIPPYGRIYGIFKTKKEAQDRGRRYVKSFSGGRRNYYQPRYSVVDAKKFNNKKVKQIKDYMRKHV